MTPGKFDLALYRGDTYTWRFMLWEDTARTVPVDLTGATAEAEFRDKSAGLRIMAFNVTISLTPSPNIIDVELTSEMWEEEDCPEGGAWDLEITMPDGDVHTIVAGKVTVTPDITNSDDPTP